MPHQPDRYYIYIASNRHRTVFYVGMTNDLQRRIYEHKSGVGSEFTSRYNITDLLYYEEFKEVRDAIHREKQLKAWGRRKKLGLICGLNPRLVDLAEQLE